MNGRGRIPLFRQREVLLAAFFVAIALGLAFLGYSLTRGTRAPPFPETCLDRVHGHCHEEESGVYAFVSNPRDPVALLADYQFARSGGGTIEDISIGADVPAGQTESWVIELLGTPRIEPSTYQGIPLGQSTGVTGLSMRAVKAFTPNAGNYVDVIQGTIIGPSQGYDVLHTVANVQLGVAESGVVDISGRTVGSMLAQKSKWVVGDLPYVFGEQPDQVPGGSAISPELAVGNLLPSGAWVAPERIFVDEVYVRPVASQLLYSATPPSAAGNTDWQGSGVIQGRFVVENLDGEASDQSREFWAGIALGLAGASLVAAVQAFAVVRRDRPSL